MGDAIQSLRTPDVCIVGSGPAGLTAALALGRAGRSVVVLESGSVRSSRRAQQLNDGDHEGLAYNGLTQTRHRQVGGTVNIWNVPVGNQRGAKFVPLSAADMADWPLRFEDLRPDYVAAQALCRLGPFEYDADPWASPVRTPFRLAGTGLVSGVYQFGTARRFNRILADEVRDTGSVILAKSVTAVGLVVERDPLRFRGIRAVAGGRQPVEVRPRAAILACGAIENARLLMLADLERRAALSWLGRGFMEHARDFSLLLVPDCAEVFAAASFYDRHSAADGTVVGGRVSPSDDARRSFELPNAAMTLIPRVRGGGGHRGMRALLSHWWLSAGPGADRYGWSQVRSPADAFDAFQIVLNLEQRPDPSNRIELSKRTDRFGNPLPRLFLTWSEREQGRLNRLHELLAEWFRTAGLGRLQYAEGRPPDLNAHHHAGTTRMGVSTKDGVVDASFRVFGFDNLFVAGASVFPSAGYANPTLTIVALAWRLARSVDEELG